MHMLMATNAAQLSDEVTIYTNGDESVATQSSSLAKAPIKTDARKIARLVNGDSAIILEFTDGSTKEEKFLAHHPQTVVQGPFIEQLGITTTPTGEIAADSPTYQTSVRGVFAAGDCITPYKAVNGAVASGCNAAVACATQIQGEKYGLPAMF